MKGMKKLECRLNDEAPVSWALTASVLNVGLVTIYLLIRLRRELLRARDYMDFTPVSKNSEEM